MLMVNVLVENNLNYGLVIDGCVMSYELGRATQRVVFPEPVMSYETY